MNALDAALFLAERGFPLFPADHPGLPKCAGAGRDHDAEACEDRGKHPAVAFTRTHTTDPAQLRRWFGEHMRNVAIAVGACSGPEGARLLVVDSDRPGAIEDAAMALGYRWEATMRVTTAKGYHDYVWVPASLHLGNGLGSLRGKFDGDVRAGNAYVIGPGSVHATGVLYELVDPEQPPVLAPAWLLKALQEPVAPVQEPQSGSLPLQRGGGALVGLVRAVLKAREGNRNNCLYWAACRAFEQAQKGQLDARSVATALVDAATAVGLPEGAARATITSAYRMTGGA